MAVDPRRAEEGLAELVSIYREGQRIVAAQVLEAIREDRIAQRAFRLDAYRKIQAELDRLGVKGDPIANRLIENAWREGDDSILREIADDTVHFNQINRGALQEAQAALVDSLDSARTTVGRQVFDTFRQAGLRSTSLGLLGAQGSGRKVSADLVARLKRNGIKAFVDKRGTKWDLEVYANMVARTTTREAVVQAQIQRMAEQNIEFARVSMASRPCPICSQWQGVLVSLGGKGATLDGEPASTLDSMPNGGPPFHPNCRHYLVPEGTEFGRFRHGGSGKGGGGGGPRGPSTPGGGEPPRRVPADEFHDAFEQARSTERGAFLSPYTPAEFAQMQCFLAYGDQVGGALKSVGQHNEAVSIFNNGGPPGSGLDLVKYLVEQGADRLDCIGDDLRALYESVGFEVVETLEWNDDFAPIGWDYATRGRPNIYVMELQ